MKNDIVLFQDDFSEFEIGPLPFDREHSAMGEYHYVKQPGYSGAWYDPYELQLPWSELDSDSGWR